MLKTFCDFWIWLWQLPMTQAAAHNERIYRSLIASPPRPQHRVLPTTHCIVPMPPVKPTRGQRPGPRKSFTDSEIAGALSVTNGHQARAAALLGCSRKTVDRHVVKFGKVKLPSLKGS